MKKYTVFSLLLLMLSACQSFYVPPSPVVAPIEQGKVALFVDIKDNPTHTHIGLTVFNNFSKDYRYSLGLEEKIFRILKNDIETNTKLGVVNIKDMGLSLSGANKWDFVKIKEKQWPLTKNLSI